MKIYIDLNEFENAFPILDAFKTYTTLKGKINFLVKGDASSYLALDDYKNIKRRSSFDEIDLKDVKFNLTTFDSFEELKNKDEETIFRVLDNPKTKKRSIFLFFNDDINHDLLKEKIDYIINFYKENVENKPLKVSLIKKFKEDKDLELFLKNNLNEFSSTFEIKDILNNDSEIVLLSEEIKYYAFSLLSNYSRFLKSEKNIGGYLSKFNPFSYQKISSKEVNLDSIFNESTFVFSKDNKLSCLIKKDLTASSFIELFEFFESFKV